MPSLDGMRNEELGVVAAKAYEIGEERDEAS
jgi:hypothetical protein